MPLLADDTGNWDVAIVVPEDGDLRDAASVSTGMTSQTRRGRWLRDVLMRENGNPGIIRVRRVSSVTLLRVITTGREQGDLCQVLTTAGGGRQYYFSETATQADDGEFVVRPADIAVDQPGRWLDVNRIHVTVSGAWLFPHGFSASGQANVENLGASGEIAVVGAGSFGGQLLVGGDISTFAGLSVNGTSALKVVTATSVATTGNINAGGAVVAPAAIVGGGSFLITATALTANEPVVASGRGRFCRRAFMVNVDTNLTFGAEDYDLVRVPNGLLTAARTYTLSTEGVRQGDMIRVINQNTAHTVTVQREGGAFLAILLNSPTGVRWADFCFMDGQWFEVGTPEGP